MDNLDGRLTLFSVSGGADRDPVEELRNERVDAFTDTGYMGRGAIRVVRTTQPDRLPPNAEDLSIDISAYDTEEIILRKDELDGRPYLFAMHRATGRILNTSPIIKGQISASQCERLVEGAKISLSHQSIVAA